MCSPRELEYVESWLDEDPQNSRALQGIMKGLQDEEHDPAPILPDAGSVKAFLDFSISRDNRSVDQPAKYMPIKKSADFTSNTRVKILAVCMVLLMAFSFSLYLQYEPPANEHTPAKIVIQERSLPYGQTATMRFSDGSVIKLNGGSTLRYPAKFSTGLRKVQLEGEAFFDIERDTERPFIVEVGNTTTRVLGTSFNIRAYSDEADIQVAVVEGRVGVSGYTESDPSAAGKEIILGTNEWASYLPTGNLNEKGRGNIREKVAWKDQVLLFNDKPFSEVARMLERWYGVDITIEDEELNKTVLAGEHNNVSLRTVLESIKFVLDIDYTMKDGEVEIMPAS